jgi:hypothetical protein
MKELHREPDLCLIRCGIISYQIPVTKVPERHNLENRITNTSNTLVKSHDVGWMPKYLDLFFQVSPAANCRAALDVLLFSSVTRFPRWSAMYRAGGPHRRAGRALFVRHGHVKIHSGSNQAAHLGGMECLQP